MQTNIRYILLTALRDFLFLGLILGLLLAVGISSAMGGMAMVEGQAMTLVFSAASARIMLMIGIIVFVAFHVRQAFEQKEIDILISRPLSRFHVMLSYWIGFSVVAFLLVLAAVTMLSFLPIASLSGYGYWSISLLLESVLVVAIALFSAFTLSSAVSSVLAALGLYVAARMMTFFVLTSESRVLFEEGWVNELVRFVIEVSSVVLPRLDLFTQSEWLVYGVTQPMETTLSLIQVLIYIPLLLAAATLDFRRKEF